MKLLITPWPASILLGMMLAGCVGQSMAQQISERQKTAQAMFEQRCKMAGTTIRETAENVDGLFLLKIRPRAINFGDQFELTDPYGEDLGGQGYIGSFLKDEYHSTHRGVPKPGSPPRLGYLYVDVIDPQDGTRYRYTGAKKIVGRKDASAPGVIFELRRNPNYDLNIYAFMLEKAPADNPAPRYGVTYDDISTREEREYWIAGSSLKVIDLKTNEVIAERIGYMMDSAQGSRAGGRSPWLLAANNACPKFADQHGASAQPYQTLDFAEKVLKPSK
ncbi:MAG: hypothetical protein V4573_05310 [Pseudomonadota bacterium]